jgi:hypothetical protein
MDIIQQRSALAGGANLKGCVVIHIRSIAVPRISTTRQPVLSHFGKELASQAGGRPRMSDDEMQTLG